MTDEERWIKLGRAAEEIGNWKIECLRCHHYIDFFLVKHIQRYMQHNWEPKECEKTREE